ncbi:MAG: hypothetical protein AB1540_09240 [Bdellovibrionota bacterium]
MKPLSLYDEESLIKMVELQKATQWDLEKAIDWQLPIDLNKPLVPLDEKALFFPGAGKEERLAISQMMGLVIAAAICEMEESLIRLRSVGWDQLAAKYPVNPEFVELGEQFFAEEEKHSEAFRRYLKKFADTAGIEFEVLREVLPVIESTKTEFILRKNLELGGYSFWWIVAQVEQEFLLLYNALAPFKQSLEPLYFDIHRKHFEEEARHASFPYLLLELLITRSTHPLNLVHQKADLMVSQLLQAMWTVNSLSRLKKLKKIKQKHPLFDALLKVYPLFEKQPVHRIFWGLFTSVPYVSSLVNPFYHRKFLKFTERMGAFSIPFPAPEPAPLLKE